jgi:hypothetical protein
MLEELERRSYAPGTIHAYLRTVEHFARHFHCPPDRLGPEHIRQYQAAMFRTWKLAPSTVTQRLAALRFLYIQVLKRGWSVAETPYPKKVLHLPQIPKCPHCGGTMQLIERLTAAQLLLRSPPYAQACRMNPKSRPRTDSMPVHAYLVCALSDFYCLWHRLPARSSNTPKYICFNELAVPALSPRANPSHPARHKHPNRIQIP